MTLDIFLVFFRLSLLSFGGVFGVLPELERMVVVEQGWLTSEKFLQAYVVGQFVPGPNMAMCPLV
ncbi:MAG: chromate transporter, partial [Bdellovibrionales bacterium]|nr:chromate transporter [Bdellovibrionales bacterium]